MQGHVKYKEPTSLFEHFIIAGLHPDANLEVVEDAFARRKKWELEMANSEILDVKMLQHREPSIPTLEPQVDCMTKSFPGFIYLFFFSVPIFNTILPDIYWVMLFFAHLCTQDLFLRSI